MAGVDELEMAFLIENAEKHCCVAADFRMSAEEAIHMIEEASGISAKCHPGERALKHGGEKRGAEPFAGNVGDEKRGAAFAERKNIKIISPDRQAGKIESGDGEVRVFAEVTREQRLLDVAGDIDFLFEALAFALAFDEAGIVQNARGIGGQRVQDLAVELGEGGRAARIQVENAEEISSLDIDHGFLGVRAGHGEKGNHYHGA